MTISTTEEWWAGQSDSWTSNCFGQGLVFHQATEAVSSSTTFYLSCGALSGMSVLALELTVQTAADNALVLLPPNFEEEDHEKPLAILDVTSIDAWRAAEVAWRSPGYAFLAAKLPSTSTSSSSSAAAPASPQLPFTIHAAYKQSCPVLLVMARRAFRGVAKSVMVQLLEGKKTKPASNSLYDVTEACIREFGGDLSDLEVLELLATRHFEKMADEGFMSESYIEMAIDPKDLEEYERVQEGEREVATYKNPTKLQWLHTSPNINLLMVLQLRSQKLQLLLRVVGFHPCRSPSTRAMKVSIDVCRLLR